MYSCAIFKNKNKPFNEWSDSKILLLYVIVKHPAGLESNARNSFIKMVYYLESTKMELL